MEPPADTASLRSQIAILQEELDSLRARYDTLLETKNRAAERYKADYKKWRDFKRWLFREGETDGHAKSFLKGGELTAYTRASALGKRKQFEEFGPNLEHAAESDHETSGHERESIREAKAERPHSPPVAVASVHQRRKSYHGRPSHKHPSPSHGSNNDPFPAPQPPGQGDEPSVFVNSTGGLVEVAQNREPFPKTPCKAEPSPSIPLTEPRKSRGRYAQSSRMQTINSRFSIRKDRNDGVDFQYDAVVRNRQERKHMLGSDCECCREYYDAVGPLPSLRQPLWRTPPKRKKPHTPRASDDDKENTDEAEEHKQRISRHRHHWHRPKTPPGYWDIGFPDTQEVLDINRRAAEMHNRKLVRVETEAKNNNGRYVERAPRSP